MERPRRYGAPDPEKHDTTPVEMPLGACRPTPLQTIFANMVKQAVAAETHDQFGTMEEEDDFTPDDEEFLLDMSPYQLSDLQEEAAVQDLGESPESPPETPSEGVDNPTGDTPDPNESEPDKP